MCLENLFNFVEVYVEQFIADPYSYDKMSSVQCLMALDFSFVKQFENVPVWLLSFIDRNIKDFITVRPEEAGVLSVNGMLILLGYEGTARRIDLLAFFIVWKEAVGDSGIEISQYVKLEELNAQELKFARASNLYSLSETTDNLERIVTEYGTTINETKAKVRNLKQMIEDKDNEIEEKDDEIEEKNSEIEDLNFKVKKLRH